VGRRWTIFATPGEPEGLSDADLMGIPAQRDGAFAELVLPGQALGVFPDLGEGELSDIDVGIAAEVDREDLG